MKHLRRILLAAALLVSAAPAFAQAPAAVPALPDTERRTSYSITATTCACTVNFALYGDSTDYQNWVEVYLNGTRVNYNDATFGWTITVPTQTLATRARPISDAILTFNSAQTGTVQIVGARRPRRVSQFSENRGVAARDLNQALTDIVAQNRETWDKTNDVTGRAVLGLPGETVGPMPSATSRAGKFFTFDGSGNPAVTAPTLGTGNVIGPGSSTVGNIPTFANTGGTSLSDSGVSLTFPNNRIMANISGSTGAPSPTSATGLFDSAYCNTVGYIVVRLTGAWTCDISIPRNVVWFGADPTGSAASDTAFTNAYATLSSIGGSIYFPTGNYKFTSGISKTMPNAQFSLTIFGDGSNATTLNWPNASGGITLTAQNNKNTFHFRDLTLTTSQVGSGRAIYVIGVGGTNGQFWQSDIHNVQINGDDISPSVPTLHYWAYSIFIHNWAYIDIANVNSYGPHQTPGSAGGGIGIHYEGNAGTSSYVTNLFISRSTFQYHTTGMELGDWWQGLNCDMCVFLGEVGTSCVTQLGSTTGVLAGLNFINGGFNCAGPQVSINSLIYNPIFIGNTITIYGNGNSGITTGSSATNSMTIVGNAFNYAAPGGWTGTFCLALAAANTGVVLGNIFGSCTTPVLLGASSSNFGVSQNRYVGTSSASNINTGTGNNIGTATP